jgi:hypothetical protein
LMHQISPQDPLTSSTTMPRNAVRTAATALQQLQRGLRHRPRSFGLSRKPEYERDGNLLP